MHGQHGLRSDDVPAGESPRAAGRGPSQNASPAVFSSTVNDTPLRMDLQRTEPPGGADLTRWLRSFDTPGVARPKRPPAFAPHATRCIKGLRLNRGGGWLEQADEEEAADDGEEGGRPTLDEKQQAV